MLRLQDVKTKKKQQTIQGHILWNHEALNTSLYHDFIVFDVTDCSNVYHYDCYQPPNVSGDIEFIGCKEYK